MSDTQVDFVIFALVWSALAAVIAAIAAEIEFSATGKGGGWGSFLAGWVIFSIPGLLLVITAFLGMPGLIVTLVLIGGVVLYVEMSS